MAASAVDVGLRLDLFELARSYASHHGSIQYLVCDEAQFYGAPRVDPLADGHHAGLGSAVVR